MKLNKDKLNEALNPQSLLDDYIDTVNIEPDDVSNEDELRGYIEARKEILRKSIQENEHKIDKLLGKM